MDFLLRHERMHIFISSYESQLMGYLSSHVLSFRARVLHAKAVASSTNSTARERGASSTLVRAALTAFERLDPR